MKQFIVLAAILPLLLLFFAQASLDRINDRRVFLAERAVRAFETGVCYAGRDGESEALALRERLAKIFAADLADVHVDICPSADGKTSCYSISVPMGKLMAGEGLLGLSHAENRGVWTAAGEIMDIKTEIDAILADAQKSATDTDESNDPNAEKTIDEKENE